MSHLENKCFNCFTIISQCKESWKPSFVILRTHWKKLVLLLKNNWHAHNFFLGYICLVILLLIYFWTLKLTPLVKSFFQQTWVAGTVLDTEISNEQIGHRSPRTHGADVLIIICSINYMTCQTVVSTMEKNQKQRKRIGSIYILRR